MSTAPRLAPADLILVEGYKRDRHPKVEVWRPAAGQPLIQTSIAGELQPISAAGLVLHGLRSTAVVRARKRGATVLQISSMFGMSEPMVARYSRLADQREMAMAAVHHLDGTRQERTRAKHLKTDS